MTERSLLVVEDDVDLAKLVALHLGDLGHQVTIEHNGRTALELTRSRSFDLVILDLTLPGLDGLELCRELRVQTPYTAILMLTARTSELDRVLGLEVGADDYLTKPFSVRELVARVKALLRRMEAFAENGQNDTAGDAAPLVAGNLELLPQERLVRIAGNPVDLTAKEFDLLEFFMRHPGRVFSRVQLLDNVWGYAHDGYEHTVNTHINRLRRKVEADPGNPQLIRTVWGVGYKLPREDERRGQVRC